jgi:hypothetical protein
MNEPKSRVGVEPDALPEGMTRLLAANDALDEQFSAGSMRRCALPRRAVRRVQRGSPVNNPRATYGCLEPRVKESPREHTPRHERQHRRRDNAA